ncbi:MAG: carbonic anhydrase [Myxococcaceae bacterium]|nr:carbonic anhydrase [Myxococcaceae bacterium]
MSTDPIDRLLAQNKTWVASATAKDPQFFERLAHGQTPEYLFIGCSDSRVPANALTGTGPGEMFVHRNIANQFHLHDLNSLAVVQYAVDVLDVSSIIVVGHYGCGGVKAANGLHSYGLVDHWLGEIRDLGERYQALLGTGEEERHHRLVELSVLQQVVNLSLCPVLRTAWKKGRRPTLAGLVYDVADGALHKLVSGLSSVEQAQAVMPDPKAKVLPKLFKD